MDHPSPPNLREDLDSYLKKGSSLNGPGIFQERLQQGFRWLKVKSNRNETLEEIDQSAEKDPWFPSMVNWFLFQIVVLSTYNIFSTEQHNLPCFRQDGSDYWAFLAYFLREYFASSQWDSHSDNHNEMTVYWLFSIWSRVSFCRIFQASFYLPVLMLKSRKFAILFTFGSLFLITRYIISGQIVYRIL